MEEFNAWDVAQDDHTAITEISNRVEEIQRLYREAVLLAKAFDLNVIIDLELPDEAKGGHNHSDYVYWRASSAHC
jgi:hypothetical protein